MNILKSIVFSWVVLLCMDANAQNDFRPGYIVTLQNDTVAGLISYRSDIGNAKSCILKNGEEKTTYTADQIKAYGFSNGKHYTSGNYLNFRFDKPLFLENVITSSVSLFHYKDEEKSHFYISKDTIMMELEYHQSAGGTSGQGQIKANPYKFRGQLKVLMLDQPSLFPKIDRLVCNKNALTSLVKEYIKLSNPEVEFISSDKKTTKDIVGKFGLFFSGGISHLSSPPYDIYIRNDDVTKYLNFNLASTFEVGAMLNFYLNFLGENKYILQLAPAVNIVEYNSNTERFVYPLDNSYKTHVKFTAFKLPLIFKYSFYNSQKVVLPFFKLGVGNTIYLNQKGKYEYGSSVQGSQVNSNVYIQSLDKLTDKKLKNYFVAGVGMDLKVGKQLLSAGATFEIGTGQLEGTRADGQLQIGFQL